MKTLNQYIKEKLIINQRFDEKLIVNKNYVDANVHILTPKSFDELRNIIQDRYKKLGPGTKQNPVDFNDIDVSNLDSFCIMLKGIFYETKFKYIDISYWDVSNVTNMSHMFCRCSNLKSVGDLSKWNVSKVRYNSYMFDSCPIKDKYKQKFK